MISLTVRANNLVDSPEAEAKAIDAIKEACGPVTVEYVATKTGLAWHQARSLLFRLAAEHKVCMQRTTLNWIFFIKEGS